MEEWQYYPGFASLVPHTACSLWQPYVLPRYVTAAVQNVLMPCVEEMNSCTVAFYDFFTLILRMLIGVT